MAYSKDNLKVLSDICIDLAINAGNMILEYYDNFNIDKDVAIKQDNSPVTTADLASHNYITNGLNNIILDKELFELPVLSEEANDISSAIRHGWDDYWLVDPLDGTKEFINKTDEFCINIALIHKHRPILGVIYVPCLKELYYGIENQGAYKIENIKVDKLDSKLNIKKISANKLNNQPVITIATSRRHQKLSKFNNFLKQLDHKKIKYNIISTGSAIKFGLIAEGKADLYPRFGLTYEWDTAAGDCILLASGGGVVKDLHENIFYYNKKDSLINPEFYATGDPDFNWQQLLQDI